MTELMQIQPFIQSYVQAVSSILRAEVTIVDSNLRRVGGTGIYEHHIGEPVPHDSFFKKILASGEHGIIKDVKKEFVCQHCKNKNSCRELANVAFPIMKERRTVGIIAVIAFDAAQREQLLQDQHKLAEFLKYMSALIESKLSSLEVAQSLEQQLGRVTGAQNEQYGFANIIGRDPAFLDAVQLAKKVSGSQSTVMLRGESGTGKELFAKAIHSESSRSNHILTTVNCAAIPENLVESELFGYEAGSFTGAKAGGHTGKFELADSSTIFLDEIGDMPLPVQTKLLRVLQEQAVERIGGKESIPIDVRVICATNRDLEDMVREGAFREDLYYRLNVIPVRIPPLRERRDDILALAAHFIAQYNLRLHKDIHSISAEVKRVFVEYNWPGNIRELRNIIEYMVNITDHCELAYGDLPDHLVIKTQPDIVSLDKLVEDYERKIRSGLLTDKASVERKRLVADMLKISPATLYRKLSKYNLL